MLAQMAGRGDRLPTARDFGSHALGCVRLAIVDAPGGGQPSLNERGDVAVVFNGEIYNHRELRSQLQRLGHHFRSECDTEVIVHAYEEWGKGLLARLRGMYAFVIVDHARKRTLAGRDPFGIKPLYYGRQGAQLLFASEIKALMQAGANGIKAVPAGGYVDNGQKSEREQFPRPASLNIDPEEAKSEIRHLLEDSVRSMLDTQLPVAVLCGGGIDSSAVLYEAVKFSKDVAVYAVGVSLEAPDVCAARCVARQLNVPFRPVIVDEASLLGSIPKVVACIESFEPNHIRGGTLSYALARAVHEDGIKVALCGEGADELLAGYPEFQEYLGRQDWETQVQGEVKRFTEELHKTQLQRVDRTNMAFAVEVRVPFLDLDFASFALSLPPQHKLRNGANGTPTAKWVLREAYRGLLPDGIVGRRKIVLSEGAGVGDNGPRGPFFEFGARKIDEADFEDLKRSHPEFRLQSKEEAYYFSIFRSLYGPLPLAAERPRVNRLPTRG
jgi:asparagine synthase (glutamine-hydrolysing)